MFKIICVTDRKSCKEDFLTRIEKISQSGVESVILREKDLPAYEYRQLAEKSVEICHKYNKPCILHSYPETALETGADGVHVTMDMLRNLPEKKIFTGVSVHSVEEAVEAEKTGVDYIIAGHIFKTDCKKGLAPRGLEFLNQVCSAVKIPVYAIGGINPDNINLVTGADGVCIMSGFMTCESPSEYIKQLRKEVTDIEV